jgi:hypothetical protein
MRHTVWIRTATIPRDILFEMAVGHHSLYFDISEFYSEFYPDSVSGNIICPALPPLHNFAQRQEAVT